MAKQAHKEAPPREVVEMGHEPVNLRAWPFVIFLVALVIGLAVSFALLAWAYAQMQRPRQMEAVSPLFEKNPIPPGPLQEASAVNPNLPQEDLAALKKHEQDILGNYAWVDKSKGIARVPIERAMEMLAKQGVPVRSNQSGSGSAADAKGGARD